MGFRPLAYRLAQELALAGWVRNTGQGVELELQGCDGQVDEFELRLRRELPVQATIRNWASWEMPLKNGAAEFCITESIPASLLESGQVGDASAEILPDLATCDACLAEVMDPADRRYRYPFTNCIHCGPRYSILNRLPYDRARTTMSAFEMCDACEREYRDPAHRRFHAQSNCCADCGPRLSLLDSRGARLSHDDAALRATAQAIIEGAVVAVQGIGGFHLLCDARNDAAVVRLRERKHREAKPFALMVKDLAQARTLCEVSEREQAFLRGPGAPIVLLRRLEPSRLMETIAVSSFVAPGLPTLGLMLPYTPLHHLLLREVGAPLVATSGNLSHEPICRDAAEARARLGGITELFLTHDRVIAFPVDDSVVREIAGTQAVHRAGRGYAPLLLDFTSGERSVLALGAHQKCSLAFGRQGRIQMSPHLGDLDTVEAHAAYRASLERLQATHGLAHARIVCDRHPDYASTRVASELTSEPIAIQHHEAHVFSCIAEHRIQGPVLGVAWDGTGYGTDGTIWGGEFMRGTSLGLTRFGSLRPFRLPGGTAALREPGRTALGLLHEMGERHESFGFDASAERTLLHSLNRGLNAPWTSSVGRLFDGVAALLGIRHRVSYEGQAAVELEAAVEVQARSVKPYVIRTYDEGGLLRLDWEPWLHGLLEDRARGLSVGYAAARFHRTLAQSIVELAKRSGVMQVALSGGCFQNRVLSEWTIELLIEAGFTPFWNQRVPTNDGGISVGQVIGGWNVPVSAS